MAIATQPRLQAGQFWKNPVTGATLPPQMPPPAPVSHRIARRKAPHASAGSNLPGLISTFVPLSMREGQRFARGMNSALRVATTPGDRAANRLERMAMENRFGAIDWAA